ncbi:hypothetical protein CMK11_15415 [Candidatus Poribacteria bacterium]|nr:hypothetical protein [Candidatus Poribacteria bacterium]
MRHTLIVLAIAAAVGCDYGNPAALGILDPAATDDIGARLIRWQAKGAIPEADVNGDGTVDITDLVIVSQNFGRDVAVGTLIIVPDIVWRNADGHPHGRVEVINGGDTPVADMRVRHIVRHRGLLVDIGDASLITALIPTPGRDVTYIAPGEHGTGWLWAAAAAWDDFQAGTVTIEVAIIRDEDSTRPGARP